MSVSKIKWHFISLISISGFCDIPKQEKDTSSSVNRLYKYYIVQVQMVLCNTLN